MDTRGGRPDQSKVEEAVRATLRGWGAELDTRQKFWWMDWTRMTEDVVEAMRTGEAVLYDDDETEQPTRRSGSF